MKTASILVLLALPCPALAQSPAEIKEARAAVADTLKDPQSARFASEYAKRDATCGTVNAKNAFGGYTGAVAYVYVRKTHQAFVLAGDAIPTSLADIFHKYCIDAPDR